MALNDDTLSNGEAPGDALIVDVAHLDLVTAELSELGLNASRETGPDALGLARITLVDSGDQPLLEVDGLLAELRRRLAAAHGGWVPPLGRDREATSSVMRGGHPKPTAYLDPAPIGVDDLTTSSIAPTPARFAPPRVGLVDTAVVDFAAAGGGTHQPWEGHAAFVKGIVTAAAPSAQIVPRAVLTRAGGRGSVWDVACAMVQLAVHERVDILLLPLACFTADGQPPLLLTRAVERVADSTLIVAAAGNQTLETGWSALGRGPSSPAWPAALPLVKAVGADRAALIGATSEATEASPSQRPPWVDVVTSTVSFTGPFFSGEVQTGEGVMPFTGHARWSGTSFCAAHAAGLVAAAMADSGESARSAWDALVTGGTLP